MKCIHLKLHYHAKKEPYQTPEGSENKGQEKPYWLTDTYRKFATVIKAARVPYTTVPEATHEYNRQFVTVCIDISWIQPKIFKEKNKWSKCFEHKALKNKGKIKTNH